MCPTDISDYVRLLNAIIVKDNLKQKDNCQKLIREVMKVELIIFHTLLISTSARSGQGGLAVAYDE